MLTGLGLLLLYGYLLHRKKKKVVLILSAVECFASTALFLNFHNVNYNFYTDTLNGDLFYYLQNQTGPVFYRIYVDNANLQPMSPMNLNQSLHYVYHGVSAYDTTSAASLTQFLAWNGQNTNMKDLQDPEVLRMLGTRYWCVYEESDLPADYSFHYVMNINAYEVYELDSWRPVAFTYTHVIPEKAVKMDEQGRAVGLDWNHELVLTDEDYNALKDSLTEGESQDAELADYYQGSIFEMSIDVPNTCILFLSIPYDEGWRVFDNGVYVQPLKVQGGFLGVMLSPGQHDISLSFQPQGLRFGLLASGAGLLGLIVVLFRDKKRPVSG